MVYNIYGNYVFTPLIYMPIYALRDFSSDYERNITLSAIANQYLFALHDFVHFSAFKRGLL